MSSITTPLDVLPSPTVPGRLNAGSMLFEAHEGSVQVGRYFQAWEFRPNVGQSGYRAEDPWVVDHKLVTCLDMMRKLIGVSITVQSGYRPAYYNQQLSGAASDSQHIAGTAADIAVSGLGYPDLAGLALLIGFRGIGLYQSHLHVDTRDGELALWGMDRAALGQHAETAFRTWIVPVLV